MTRIMLDAAFLSKLRNLTEPLEICNESGQVLGRFFPAPDLSQYAPLEPQVSDEELSRREQSTEWFSTAEVLAHLEKL